MTVCHCAATSRVDIPHATLRLEYNSHLQVDTTVNEVVMNRLLARTGHQCTYQHLCWLLVHAVIGSSGHSQLTSPASQILETHRPVSMMAMCGD